MAFRKYQFIGEKPDRELIRLLSSAPFPRKPLSKPERDTYVKSWSRFLLYSLPLIGIPAIIDVISSYVGYISIYIAVFAVISVICGIGCIVISFGEIIKAIKDPRPKTPEAAVTSFLKNVLIGSDTYNILEKSTSFAYHKLRRLIPDEIPIDADDFKSYIKSFRAPAFTFLAKMHQKYIRGTFKERYYNEKYKILKTTSEAGESFVTVKMFFNVDFCERAFGQYADHNYSYADLIISIEITLVRSGKFWIITDPMPKWEDVTPVSAEFSEEE
jgi:hypothetical protein